MTIYSWVLLVALFYLLLAFILFAIKILPSKWRTNPAPPLGRKWPAVFYSFTGAMSPAKKESAYLHLPTYTAGMLFHIGLFVSMLNLLLVFLGISYTSVLVYVLSIFFIIGAVCGMAILIKRLISPLLRKISNPDDYISNVLVTGFQIFSILAINNSAFINLLYLYTAIMLLYLPIGKLRHSFFFFTSRIALGFFYGTRGVWGLKSKTR